MRVLSGHCQRSLLRGSSGDRQGCSKGSQEIFTKPFCVGRQGMIRDVF